MADATETPASEPEPTVAVEAETSPEGRFVIIDGVQISRKRAIARGLLAVDEPTSPDGPESNKARSVRSTRRGAPTETD